MENNIPVFELLNAITRKWLQFHIKLPNYSVEIVLRCTRESNKEDRDCPVYLHH